MNSLLAKLCLIIVAIVWGSGFIAARMALDAHVTPFYMMAFRFSIAAVLLIVIFYRYLKISFKKHILPGVIIGVFMYLGFAFQTIGLQFTTPSKNAFLTSTNVMIAPFIFWIIFSRKPTIQTFIGAFVAILGIGFISINITDFSIGLGDTLTLICAAFFACHIVSIGYYIHQKNLEPLKLVVIQMSVAAILAIISALIFEEFTMDLNFKGIGSVVHLGIFSTFVAFLLQNIAQKYVISTTAAIILSTEALFGAILSVLVLKEQLTPSIIIGGLLMLVAVFITEWQLPSKSSNPTI